MALKFFVTLREPQGDMIFMSIITKIFGDPNERVVRKIKDEIVSQINVFESKYNKLSDEELRGQTEIFRGQLKDGKTLDDLLPDAFAVVREAARRVIGLRHFDVQLVGGIVLHRGQIAEMKTGEGKTLVATLPLYLNALTGKGAHLVTVNDYLSKIGVGWMGPVYHALGLSVGVIVHEQAFVYDPTVNDDKIYDERLKHFRPVTRQEAYRADITYGTNNEFGFDFLKDNMVYGLDQMVGRGENYAIVDEVDSILVDEARTPLIISAPDEESSEKYYQFADLVSRLTENEDYNIDEKMRAATLTEEGIHKMEKWLGVENIYVEGGITSIHHIEQALKARTLFKRDRDYVVRPANSGGEEVVIVDEFTGRLMFGRRYSEGLHQAIEAKEGVKIQRESKTLATVTFQNLFRLYKKLAGMTGTALTEAEEFSKIYNLEVVPIPTNKPMVRKNRVDRIYKNETGKFKAVIEEIKMRHEKGQPVLVGTISIEKNELLSEMLAREGIEHNLLNAKNHLKEAEFISQAGRTGAVTIATNMAGRGVDIILGGNPSDPEEQKKVIEAGGLHVIGTERHESRRIDNQLRGRAGRQGDPGSSQFYVSMEDDLMRIFGSDRMKRIMETLGVPEDMPIENRMIGKSIESAQRKVEGHNFDIRKHLLDYDDVLNKHREVIYRKRREVLEISEGGREGLEGEGREEGVGEAPMPRHLREMILKMVEDEIEQVVLFHTASEEENNWNLEEIYEVANTIFPIPADARIKMDDLRHWAGDKAHDAAVRTAIIEYLVEQAKKAYIALEEKIADVTKDSKAIHQVEQGIILRSIDTLWIEHLEAMDHLRHGIGLRGYGQRDPLVEYKKESYKMFHELLNLINKQIVYSIYKVGVATEMAPSMMEKAKNVTFQAPAKEMEKGAVSFGTEEVSKSHDGITKVRDESGQKIGRNDPCPCGATKSDGRPIKYKHCHGKDV
jgi:preprotein translocase subunit SecA